MRRVFLALAPALFAYSASAQQSDLGRYFCTGSEAVGFTYLEEESQWTGGHFKIDDSRFILRPLTGEEFKFEQNSKYVVERHGSGDFIAECEPQSDPVIFCESYGHQFWIDTERNRFKNIYEGGFTGSNFDQDGQNTDTPTITIGTCSKI